MKIYCKSFTSVIIFLVVCNERICLHNNNNNFSEIVGDYKYFFIFCLNEICFDTVYDIFILQKKIHNVHT